MWVYILQNVVLSIGSILLIQYIWDYFRHKYSTRKTKDLVDSQTKKYRDILKEYQESVKPDYKANNKSNDADKPTGEHIGSNGSEPEYMTPEEKQKMIDELMSFVAW